MIARATFRRFFEIMGMCCGFSAVLALLSIIRIPFINGLLSLFLVVFSIMFVVFNVMLFRRCYFDMKGKISYYIVNYTAYTVFAGISAVTYVYLGDIWYTWLFAITKIVSYFTGELTNVESAALFHFMMYMAIAIAPIGLKQLYAWRFD